MKHGQPEAIDDRAAAWVARIDAGALDEAAAGELETWLEQDSRHRGAFVRMQAAWTLLDRASVLRSDPAPPVRLAFGTEPPQRRAGVNRRSFIWGAGAVAASVAGAIGLVARWQHVDKIETALGEVRRVPLNDGSIAAVNTSTRLSIDMGDRIRNIRLDRGEAWFQVAKDHTRPFVVAAGEIRVRAVGTAFSVQRRDDGADVQVTEGTVEVWTVGRESERRLVSAGARTFASAETGPAAPVQASVDIDRSLAWREGQLVLQGNSLGEAAAQFNRYNLVKIEVATDLQGERIVGRFRTNEPQAFAAAVAAMTSSRAERRGDLIILSRS